MVRFMDLQAHALFFSVFRENLISFFAKLLSFQRIFKIIHNPL